MIPAPHYSQMNKILNDLSFEPSVPTKHNVVGFIFIDQNIKRPEVSDLLSNLSLLDEISGEMIHFFLCGVSLYDKNDGDDAIEIGTVGGAPAFHNTKASVSFQNEFEKQIETWRYNLGVDVVMMDVISVDGRRVLDFSSAIFFKIDEFIKLKLVDRTTEFLRTLIRFRQDSKLNRAKDAKLALREKFGINWFKGLVLSLFPKKVQDMVRLEVVLGGGSPLREET